MYWFSDDFATWQLVIGSGATKSPAHPEDGDGVCCRNVGKPLHPDEAVCLRKFNSIFCKFHIILATYEVCPESKDTKVLNMHNIFNLQKRHYEWIACT